MGEGEEEIPEVLAGTSKLLASLEDDMAQLRRLRKSRPHQSPFLCVLRPTVENQPQQFLAFLRNAEETSRNIFTGRGVARNKIGIQQDGEAGHQQAAVQPSAGAPHDAATRSNLHIPLVAGF